MNKVAIKEWLTYSDQTKKNIFSETAKAIGLPDAAVEKDWWVVRTLELVFDSSIAAHTVFKGGTSLSKAWNLIDRFSEDIDLALDRRFLAIDKTDAEMKRPDISKLRKKSFKFISENYYPEITEKFKTAGFEVRIQLGDYKAEDQDPLTIEIYYPSVTDPIAYLQPRVLIEVGSRSLMEPLTPRSFSSFVGEHFKGRKFADLPITVPTVNPERTFLEKIFLLHEEHQRLPDKMKIERKSRHLYDLEKLLDTEYASQAFKDENLYNTIVEHRAKLNKIGRVDYSKHSHDKINPIPPDEIIALWEKDYVEMQQSMFYNPSLPFNKLIDRIKELKARINKLNMDS